MRLVTIILVWGILLSLNVSALEGQTACDGFMPSRLRIGELARVTPGAANNVRAEPNLDAELVFNVPGGGQFMPLEGPICSDDGAWWWIQRGAQTGWTLEGRAGDYWTEPFDAQLGVPDVPYVLLFNVPFIDHRSYPFVWDWSSDITYQLVFTIGRYYQLTWSPDGMSIVLLATSHDYHTSRGVFLMDASGENQRLIYNDWLRSFAWSPDQSMIVTSYPFADLGEDFSQVTDPFRRNVLVMPSSGGELRLLTNMPQEIVIPETTVQYSPDGSRIYFEMSTGESRGIYYANASATETTDVVPVYVPAPPLYVSSFDISPDGTRILVEAWSQETGSYLAMLDSEGNYLFDFFAPLMGGIASFSWAPDGSGILIHVKLDFTAERLYYMTPDAETIYDVPLGFDAVGTFDWRPVPGLPPAPPYRLMESEAECPGFLPTRIEIGDRIRVTSGTANNFRESPIQASALITQLDSSAQLTAQNGPICTEEGVWWYAIGPSGGGWTLEGNTNTYWLEVDQ